MSNFIVVIVAIDIVRALGGDYKAMASVMWMAVALDAVRYIAWLIKLRKK